MQMTGHPGSNFDRAEFRRMLTDIELGIINMVILKERIASRERTYRYELLSGEIFPGEKNSGCVSSGSL